MDEQIVRFLRTLLPPFVAPTDPKRWPRQAARIRREALRRIYLKGWPRELVAATPRVVWGEVLRPDPSYRVRKLRYEIYPDYWIPALLYEPARLTTPAPVVLNPNGHHAGGKAATYKQARCINLARRGAIALSFEFLGMGELNGEANHNGHGYLDVTGMASVGFFYLAMSKALDVLLSHRRADRRRVAVTGLSGGGWQTIVISAMDRRVTLSVPVAGYTSLAVRTRRIEDIGDLEQIPPDLTTVLDYPHMTAMLAPRPALLILNKTDTCCFRPDHTKPAIYDAVRPTYAAFEAGDRFACHINTDPGTHNYEADNRNALYQFLARHFGMPAVEGDLHREDEILTEQELAVGLPPAQTAIRTVARHRARRLAATLATPATSAGKRSLRAKLAKVIRLPSYTVRPWRVGRSGATDLVRLRVGPWKLPAAIRRRGRSRRVELVVSDSPGAGAAYLDSAGEGTTALVDILGTGLATCDPCYPMMLQSAGRRVLGEQVAQILAAADWYRRKGRCERVHLAGLDVISSFAALVAAALAPERFASLTVRNLPMSLADLFDRPVDYNSLLPILCPDLLTVADLPQLVALLEGVPFLAADRCVAPIEQALAIASEA